LAEPYDGFIAQYKAGTDDPEKRMENLAFMAAHSSKLCTNIKTSHDKEISFVDSAKYVCFSPTDYEKVRDWYKSQCSKDTQETDQALRYLDSLFIKR
jgi:hypothetical protein